MIDRAAILKYAKETYDTESEHLWKKWPTYEILRHKHNNKWYAALLDVEGTKVGMDDDAMIDILDVKCEPEMIVNLIGQKGFAPAYHMNKEHWITVLLDGSLKDDEILRLLDLSYEMTK